MSVKQQIGRLGKLFVKEQADYVTPAVLAAGDALRHLDVGFSYNLNRQNSLEKKGTPGLTNRFSRHIEAAFDLKNAYLSPSGTLKTAPEAKAIIKNGMGAEVVGTLTTTATGAGTATTFTLASTVGLAVDEFVFVRRAANAGRVEPRRVTAIVGSDITVSPALGAAPAAADTVKSGVTYKLANDLPKVLTAARYLPDVSFELHSVAISKLGFMLSGNDEVRFKAQGPAMEQIRPAQAQPGAFTTVGQPVTGIVGAVLLNGVAYRVTSIDAEIDNAIELVNDSLGTDRAEDFYRNGRRDITLALNARVTDDASLYALAETAGDGTLLAHVGNTEGRVIAIYAPRAEFDIPDVPDDDGAIRWSFKGVAKETNGNDELFVAFG